MKIDEWVWGREKVVWGFDPSHRYTFKIIEPKKGRAGCLSLQYHHEKDELWLCLTGRMWALAVIDGTVCTWNMAAGDMLVLPKGVIHRLTAITDGATLCEPSTPDAHAADKSVPKDVVRLHCTLGRDCAVPRNAREEAIVVECIAKTEEAIAFIEKGELPPEHHRELFGELAQRI